jgi:DNA-dependent RNA polymerase auxiliary subunit epsilon
MKKMKMFYIIEKVMTQLGAILMVFKVYYQERITEVPVRENTKTLYIEGESVRDVRTKIADRGYNVESVQEVKGAYLNYEQQNVDYKVLEK